MKSRIKIKLLSFTLGIIVTLAMIVLINFSFKDGEAEIENLQNYPQNYRIVTPEFPENLTIFDEKIPLEDSEIRERIEREFIVNSYWHSSTLLLIKRANRWFPVIEPILEENNVPEDFKYISMIESNLMNSVSPRNAVGFWQFIKSAALKYDLEVNGEVDERYNVEKSTEAACKYLKDSYDIFGSWTMAAASYNMGVSGTKKQSERQKTKSYFELTLNEETSRYIARAISMKIIFNNPEKYGFEINDDDLYEEFDTYEVEIKNSVKHFADFASKYGLNYKTLKYFNPWLRENYLTNKYKRTYQVKIPNNIEDYMVEEK